MRLLNVNHFICYWERVSIQYIDPTKTGINFSVITSFDFNMVLVGTVGPLNFCHPNRMPSYPKYKRDHQKDYSIL